MTTTTVWARLSRRLVAHGAPLAGAFFLALLQSALMVPIAWLLKRAFDEAIPQHDGRLMFLVGVGILALRSGAALIAYWGHALQLRVCLVTTARLRTQLSEAALQYPRSFYQSREIGGVQRLFAFDTERVGALLQALLGQVIPSAILSLLLASVLAWIDFKLFLMLLLVWPVTWILNEVFRRRVVTATRQYNRVYHRYSEHFRWLLEALDFVRVQHAEALERKRCQGHIDDLGQAMHPMAKLNALYLQWQGLLLTALSLIVLLVGGSAVAAGRLSLGDLLSFFTVVTLMNSSLRELAVGLYHVFVGLESLRNVEEFLDLDQSEPYSGHQRLQVNRCLELDSVHFSYSTGHLLQSVSLRLQAGQWVALMGPNGCGKSTAVALLLGFIRPSRGRILADGVEYTELDIGYLRSQLGVVPQGPVLFGGTIFENVAYGEREVGRSEVEEALRRAAAWDWVQSLPLGLETPIGEGGKLLSGGQRQKLAIARALVHRPAFLILDEPTNHLDLRAMSEIFRQLRTLPQGPAILLVTHDEGVVDHVDEVVRLGGSPLAAAASPGVVG